MANLGQPLEVEAEQGDDVGHVFGSADPPAHPSRLRQYVVRARPAGNGVVVEVEDDGVGVRVSADEVFDRRSPASAGHGIGLALARSLAEANEGRLVLSRPRPHPVFTLALVAAPDPTRSTD